MNVFLQLLVVVLTPLDFDKLQFVFPLFRFRLLLLLFQLYVCSMHCKALEAHTNAQEKRANFMRPVHLLGMHNYSRTESEYSFPTSHTPFFLVLFTDIIYIFSSLVAMVRGKTNFLSAALTAFFGNMTILWHTHVCVLHMCVCIYVCVQVLKLNTY